MKILQVLPFFGHDFGGSFVSLYNLSKELSLRNHEVTVITTDYKLDAKSKKSLEDYGVNVIPFHCLFNLGLFLFSPTMDNWLKKNISSFDVIHLQTSRAYQNILISKYANTYKIPYVIHARGSLPLITGKSKLKKIYDFFYGQNILKNCSKAIALTDAEYEEYELFGVNKNKIEIVPNGIDLSMFINLPEKGYFRKKYGIGNNEKIILYLGQIHKNKGIELLVDAFSELIKNIENLRLVIVGPDSGFLSDLNKKIKKLNIEDKVILTGPIYGEDKIVVYVDSDVYVLPSIQEGFPNTVLEASVCGKSSIVTKNCNIFDVIKETGYQINYDVEELKSAIILSILNQTPQKSKSIRNKIFEEFNLETMVDKIELIYEYVVENK